MHVIDTLSVTTLVSRVHVIRRPTCCRINDSLLPSGVVDPEGRPRAAPVTPYRGRQRASDMGRRVHRPSPTEHGGPAARVGRQGRVGLLTRR